MIVTRIVPVLLLVGALALIFGYAQPTYSGDIARLRAEVRDADAALAAAEDFKRKELSLAEERATLPGEQLARLETFLPDSVDNVQLIVDLNALAGRSGMLLSQFSTQDSSGGGSDGQEATLALESAELIETLELSVSAAGTYESFLRFLSGVEQSLRPLDVVQLTVGDSDTGIYTYDLTFRLYWLR